MNYVDEKSILYVPDGRQSWLELRMFLKEERVELWIIFRETQCIHVCINKVFSLANLVRQSNHKMC